MFKTLWCVRQGSTLAVARVPMATWNGVGPSENADRVARLATWKKIDWFWCCENCPLCVSLYTWWMLNTIYNNGMKSDNKNTIWKKVKIVRQKEVLDRSNVIHEHLYLLCTIAALTSAHYTGLIWYVYILSNPPIATVQVVQSSESI